MTRHPNVVNIEDLEWSSTGMSGTRFEGFRKSLASKAGAEKLGVSLYRLAPGKRGFPLHCHFANEEGIYILSGEGSALFSETEIAVHQGDYLAFPTGTEHAHQLINTGTEDLVYLCISTMIEPDVVGYPDADKIGVFTGTAPGGPKRQRHITGFWRRGEAVPYLDGEDTD